VNPTPSVAVVGAGWAGLAAAVRLAGRGASVTLFEASRALGGRARRVDLTDGSPVLDNGQHILIGAYTSTLDLLRTVGVQPEAVLQREPLDLRRPDGSGLALSRLPAPLDALIAIATAGGWTWSDRATLLQRAATWRLQGFRCDASDTVAELCRGLPPRVMDDFIEPLCVSALNVGSGEASARVFLRVLRDALFGAPRGSDLLLPRTDLGRLLPDTAARWLAARGCAIRIGQRVRHLTSAGRGWRVDADPFDAVVLATPATEAARLVQDAGAPDDGRAMRAWADCAAGLSHTAIATVYAQTTPDTNGCVLPRAMLALPGCPAQFVFDRARLGGPAGLLAFVVSDARGERDALQALVLAQGREVLGLRNLHPLRTFVERRATFACTPAARRPWATIANGLQAAGDHVDGPYPATLEGAVRSGEAAAEHLLRMLASA
jgi:hydroxysqualene dehydroxylase